MKILNKYPLFLVLLPAFILLHIEKDYKTLINYAAVYKEIWIICLIPFLIYGLSWLLYRSIPRSNLFSLVALFLFYYLGDIKDTLSRILPNSFWQSYTFVLPAAFLLLVFAFFRIKRTTNSFPRFFRYIHLLLLLIIAIDLVSIIRGTERLEKHQISTLADFKPCTECATPDIYYIMVDEYTSSATLQKNFGFDNSGMDNYLNEKGFQLLPGFRSNYTLTAFSLSSIFSLNYLTSVDTADNFYLRNYLPGMQIMYDTPLFPMLEKQGYRVYNHSIFNIKGHPPMASIKDYWSTRQLYQQHNIIRKMDNEIGWNFPHWIRFRFGAETSFLEDQDEYDSTNLVSFYRTLHEKPGQPKFVYAHLMSAHFPSLRDSAGHKLELTESLFTADPHGKYIQQIVYTNKLLRQMIDSILEVSSSPPVIIVQSDHGFRSRTRVFESSQFSAFSAMYFPDHKPVPNDSLRSVNTFRFVFNHLFRQHYPMLEDHFYFLKHWPR